MPEQPEISSQQNGTEEIRGTVRLAGRDQNFSEYFSPGDIAVINIADIDRNFASALLLLRPSAVLNVQQSATGRAPSLGAQDLVNAGIILVDDLGSDLSDLHEADEVTVRGGDVFRGSSLVATGIQRTAESLEITRQQGRQRLGIRVRSYAMAIPENFEREEALIIEGQGLPNLRALFQDRTALVLSTLPSKVKVSAVKQLAADQHVVLVAVGAQGISAAKKIGRKPDVIVGDVGNANLSSVQKAETVVLLERPDGRARGERSLREQAIAYHSVPTSLGEEEVAILLAFNSGARLIIESTPASSLEALVDAGSAAFSGALFVRAQLSGVIISVEAALKIDRPGFAGWLLVLMVLVAIAVMVASVLFTPWGSSLLQNSLILSGAEESKTISDGFSLYLARFVK